MIIDIQSQSTIIDIDVMSIIIDIMRNITDKPIKTPAQFGAAIKERRVRLGLDQASLAHRAGISRAWLLELEKGKPGFSIGLIFRVLHALEMSIYLSAFEATGKQRSIGAKTTAAVDL